MLAAAITWTLPDLVAIGLVVCLPVLIMVLLCPAIVPVRSAKRRLKSEPAAVVGQGSAPLGLAGQWAIQERRIASGIERQTQVLGLHQQIATQIGALDYEIDQLWRETRALKVTTATARANVSSLFPATHTPRPIAQAYEAFRRAAGEPHREAMAS
jgi:hypothetical protein